MDDPSTLSVGVRPRAGETEEVALGRAEAFVAGTVGPAAQGEDAAGALNAFGFLMGLSDLPDAALAQNPYGVAFSRGRRHQLGLDPSRLRESILNVKDDDLRRARELFSPARRAAGLVSPR
jgi:zinc protease